MKKMLTKCLKVSCVAAVAVIGFAQLAHARVVPVPEPATMAFVGSGLAGVGVYWILRKKKNK